jgi:ABC-type uncharacterized transport system permease subunit
VSAIALTRSLAASAVAPVVALAAAGLCALAVGENPFTTLRSLILGGLGGAEQIAFTLYYTTDFIFTGLAVAIAYRAGLFNIGVEGQALVAGVGLSLAALGGGAMPSRLPLIGAMLGAILFGAIWGAIPGWLRARRGSHVVITTIMFNFLASALVSWLLVDPLRAPGSMQPESRPFPDSARLLRLDDALALFGLPPTGAPLNASLLIALAAIAAAHVFVFRSRAGFDARVHGANPDAAAYAGISSRRVIVLSMAISGALAAGVAMNELLGAQNRLILDFPAGAGFVGIAVALMARNRPFAILPAALLFGVLYQGGAELAFDNPRISRDLVTVAQGLVVLVVGGFPLARRRYGH